MALWMNKGAVNVVNGSKSVTGVGTAFLTSANPARVGQPMIIADIFYEIEKVVSDTSILLATNYRGVTANNVAYSVVTTAEGSSTDLARRAAQVMGYYQGQLDTLNALMAGTGSVTATLPDGTVVTLPAWSELTKIENIKPGTMQGPMAVANMKSAIKVDNQKSISYQDGANPVFHTMAYGDAFRISSGVSAGLPLFGFSSAFAEAYTHFYAKSLVATRNAAKTNWLALETPESGDPYISSRGAGENDLTIPIRFGSTVTIEKPVYHSKAMHNFNSLSRSWVAFGVANYKAETLTGGVGALRAALSYPFSLSGSYTVDAYIGTYAPGSTGGSLCHVLGATNGDTFNRVWMFSLDGQLVYKTYSGPSDVTGATSAINSLSPMTAPSFTPTSDSRLKPEELREEIVEASSFLRKQKPMYFFKKYAIDSDQGFYEFGFIADFVEKDEPRLVFETNDEHHLKHLAITGMIPHLVKGWQEHDEAISQLQQLNLSERLQVIERQLGILDTDGVRQSS